MKAASDRPARAALLLAATLILPPPEAAAASGVVLPDQVNLQVKVGDARGESYRRGPLEATVSVSARDAGRTGPDGFPARIPMPPFLVVVEVGLHRQYLYPMGAIYPGAPRSYPGSPDRVYDFSVGFLPAEKVAIPPGQTVPLGETMKVTLIIPDGPRIERTVPLSFKAEWDPGAETRRLRREEGLRLLAENERVPASSKRKWTDRVAHVAEILRHTTDSREASRLWQEGKSALGNLEGVDRRKSLGRLQKAQMEGAVLRSDADLYRTLVSERDRLGLLEAGEVLKLMELLVLLKNDVEGARSVWPRFVDLALAASDYERRSRGWDRILDLALLLPERAVNPDGGSDLPPPIETTEQYKTFRGESDGTIAGVDAWKDWVARWARDYVDAVEQFPGLTAGAAIPGETLADLMVTDPGSRMRQVFEQDLPTSLIRANPYAAVTIMPEEILRKKIAAWDGVPLTPARVIRMALDACSGSYPLAVLTSHNLLKDVTKRGRDTIERAVAARRDNPDYYRKNFRAILRELDGHNEIVRRLVSMRRVPAETGDKMGPWYHIFAVMGPGALLNSAGSYAAVVVEHGKKRMKAFQNEAGFNYEKFFIDWTFAGAALALSEHTMERQGENRISFALRGAGGDTPARARYEALDGDPAFRDYLADFERRVKSAGGTIPPAVLAAPLFRAAVLEDLGIPTVPLTYAELTPTVPRGRAREHPRGPGAERATPPAAAPSRGGAYLGVIAYPVDAISTAVAGVPPGAGVIVSHVVPGSAAAGAGLALYDVITAAAGEPVRTSEDLFRLVGREPPGGVLTVRVKRLGDVRVTLGERPTPSAAGLPGQQYAVEHGVQGLIDRLGTVMAQGFRLTALAGGHGAWYGVFSQHREAELQAWAAAASYADIESAARKYWDAGWWVREVGHNGTEWLAVFTRGPLWSSQSLIWHAEKAGLASEIERRWSRGERVTSLARGPDRWVAALTSGTGIGDQSFKGARGWGEVEAAISQGWAEGSHVTGAARGGDDWLVTFSRSPDAVQRWEQGAGENLARRVEAAWREGYRITGVSDTAEGWLVLLSKQR